MWAVGPLDGWILVLAGTTGKNHENPQDRLSPGRDSNSGPPKHEARVIIKRSRSQLMHCLVVPHVTGTVALPRTSWTVRFII
jgi:hypothetical protein